MEERSCSRFLYKRSIGFQDSHIIISTRFGHFKFESQNMKHFVYTGVQPNLLLGFSFVKIRKAFTAILLVSYLQTVCVVAQHKGDEICETLPSEIHLIKGEL